MRWYLKSVKTIEAFPFFNELDLLELHLETHWQHVDKFVITESKQSHRGVEKPLFLSTAKSLLSRYGSKIELVVLDGFPSNLTPFEADAFQRDQAKPFIESFARKDSLLLYGDVDEIVKPHAFERGYRHLESEKATQIVHFAQRVAYFYLNNFEVTGKLLSHTGEYPGVVKNLWLGSSLSRWDFAQNIKLSELRNPEHKDHGHRISDGGWHFSWVGGPSTLPALDRVLEKLRNSAHAETDTYLNRAGLERRILRGGDLIRRRGAKFARSDLKEDLPDYVNEHMAKFSHLILDPRP